MSVRYLTTARLSTAASARAMMRVLSPSDPNRAMDTHHQLVWSLFAGPERVEAERDFLWRVDGDAFTILSAEVPRDEHALFDLDVRPFEHVLANGQMRRFRLRVNATVCRTDSANGKKSRRHDVVMDTTRRLQAEDPAMQRSVAREQAVPIAAGEWMQRVGIGAGFEVQGLDAVAYQSIELGRRGKRSAQFGILDIDGVLRVEDAQELEPRLFAGFGRAKAFGCGLMLLRA